MKTLKSIVMTIASLIGAAALSTAPAAAQGTGPSAPSGGPTEPVAPKPAVKISPAVDIIVSGSLEITAVDKCGRPVPGSHIEAIAVRGSNELVETMTDAKGSAMLKDLAPGTWFVAAYYGAGDFLWKIVEVKAGTTTHVSFALPTDMLDTNLDGNTDSIDFFDFLIAWADAEPLGDFNRDGAVDSHDFYDYMNAYLAGCLPPPAVAADDSIE